MLAKTSYVEKIRKNKTTDKWHARLGHVSYKILKVMMMKSMVKGLSNLEVRDESICAGCQDKKTHQLPYGESKFRVREPLELIYSDVFGLVKQLSIGGF